MTDANRTELIAGQRQDEMSKPENELLELPYTLPDNAYAVQVLSVFEDQNNDCAIHVNFAESLDHASENYAEMWGWYLADAAHAMVRDYARCLLTDRDDGDLLAAIRDEFNKRLKQQPSK
jgi:Domain of unknown function (DUF5076)